MEHHRLFNLFIKATRAERVSGTVFFTQKYSTQPTVSPEDAMLAATHQLMALLKGNTKGNNEELEALTKVADIFDKITKDKAEMARKNKSTGNGIRQYSDNWRKANLQGWRKANLQGCLPGLLLCVHKRLLSHTKAQIIKCHFSQIISPKINPRNSHFNEDQKE